MNTFIRIGAFFLAMTAIAGCTTENGLWTDEQATARLTTLRAMQATLDSQPLGLSDSASKGVLLVAEPRADGGEVLVRWATGDDELDAVSSMPGGARPSTKEFCAFYYGSDSLLSSELEPCTRLIEMYRLSSRLDTLQAQAQQDREEFGQLIVRIDQSATRVIELLTSGPSQ